MTSKNGACYLIRKWIWISNKHGIFLQQMHRCGGHRFLRFVCLVFFVAFFFCSCFWFIVCWFHQHYFTTYNADVQIFQVLLSWCTTKTNVKRRKHTNKQSKTGVRTAKASKKKYSTFIWIRLAHSECIFHINQSFRIYAHNSAMSKCIGLGDFGRFPRLLAARYSLSSSLSVSLFTLMESQRPYLQHACKTRYNSIQL